MKADEPEGPVEAAKRANEVGANVVVLEEGDGGARELYAATIQVAREVKGALLLVADRADLAEAAGADGGVITPRGVPAAVAKRALPSGAIMAARVDGEEGAKTAEEEGASLILAPQATVGPAKDRLQSAVVVQAGFHGRCDPKTEGAEITPEMWRRLGGPFRAVALFQRALERKGGEGAEADPLAPDPTGTERDELRREVVKVVAEVERMAHWRSELSRELGKLEDARRQLEQPFTVVVAGEFNSGKSSVLNALLGGPFLLEGCLPTTEGVTAIRYGEEEGEEVRNDGLVIRRMQSEVVRRVQLVDTPGTNAVLREQQELAEEFVPRADMAVVVISADRPFAKSEGELLSYLRRYNKEVCIAVNKCDLLSSDSEVQRVLGFVEGHAERALGYKPASVVPVAAKRINGCERLAKALFDDALNERAERLKLLSPIHLATSSLAAALSALRERAEALDREADLAADLPSRTESLRSEVHRHSKRRRESFRSKIEESAAKAEALVDSWFSLPYVSKLLASYIAFNLNNSSDATLGPLGNSYTEAVATGPAASTIPAIEEHLHWMARQRDEFLDSAAKEIRQRGFPCGPAEAAEADPATPSAALSHANDFSHNAAARLLDQEAKEAASSVAMVSGGIASIGLLTAASLPAALQDAGVIGIAGITSMGSAVFDLAMRRSAVKGKIRRVASGVAKGIEEELDKDEEAVLASCYSSLSRLAEPWMNEARRLSSEISESISHIESLSCSLDSLRKRAENI